MMIMSVVVVLLAIVDVAMSIIIIRIVFLSIVPVSINSHNTLIYFFMGPSTQEKIRLKSYAFLIY